MEDNSLQRDPEGCILSLEDVLGSKRKKRYRRWETSLSDKLPCCLHCSKYTVSLVAFHSEKERWIIFLVYFDLKNYRMLKLVQEYVDFLLFFFVEEDRF